MNELVIKNRFELGLCEIYGPSRHGQFSEECYGHYITIYTHKYQEIEYFSESDEENDEDEDEYWEMNEIASLHKKVYRAMPSNKITHPFIRNYQKIMKNENYIQPEIIEKYFINMEIRGNFYPLELAIKKTVWIRIIQRAWKRVYSERCRIIQMIEKNPSLILKRQTHVNFNRRMPSLYGMLSSLKK
jgi:hypothetical protein